ncbi:MAG: sigma-54-dependent Fis family transcriptional regulator [Planctomycetales bacterium]|nr:sigma-54-dependent Fis family transcriptional regulator [Planctomycetales bacterium]
MPPTSTRPAAAQRPLVLAYLPDKDARRALGDLDADVQTVRSPAGLLTSECPRHPRLLLLHALPEETQAIVEVARQLRRERPLPDVVIWAPQAKASAVRDFFRAGAKDVVVSRAPQRLADVVRETLDEQRLLPRLSPLGRQRNRGARFESMLSRSERMWDLFELCSRVAPADATVLIVGETGTGKELLARALHRRSGRAGRFVAANCASIPPELINSELFGHEKGAFTGAHRAKRGLVAHANRGTLFLDEVGDMAPEAQQSLLRMLQERRVRPVGSLTEQVVDVRVVAATNVPLDEAVRAGAFREDLFYRLDVIRMSLPPLRERPEDILFLFGHFTKQLAKHYGLSPPTFTDSFIDALLAHDWPGNVRQLENLSERLVLARPSHALQAADFRTLSDGGTRAAATEHRGESAAIDTSLPLEEQLRRLVEERERAYLVAVLTEHHGRIAAAAEQAGISRRTLLRKMNYHQLDKRSFRQPGG